MTGNSKKASVFGLAVFAMLSAICTTAEAQPTNKMFRIGYLSSRTPASDASRRESRVNLT